MKQLQKKEIKKKFKKFKRKQEIYVIAENVEYAKNVASIFRTCDAAGVRKLFLTGISITPPFGKELMKASRAKEQSVPWEYVKEATTVMGKLKSRNFKFIAVEITDVGVSNLELKEAIAGEEHICFVVGSEMFGLKKETLSACDMATHIPMYGKGASLNVGVSLGVALFSV